MQLSHFNENGLPRMVDVGAKADTVREAVAFGSVQVNRNVFDLIRTGGASNKGDVLATAQVAGIMGAKRTSDIIPMCHNVPLSGVDIIFLLDEQALTIGITATTRCTGTTGVEMEALTAVSVAALTIYDMCKAVQKDICIGDIHLLRKMGGKSGTYEYSGNSDDKR